MKNIGIAIAGTSGYPIDDAALARGISRLQSQGYIVHNYYDAERKFERFAASDGERLAQLNAAAADPECQIVIALRGQYGISRILPHIDFRSMADSGKLFVGFSDITAFHMGLYQATGRISFAGPMSADLVREEPVAYTLKQFWDCLKGPTHSVRGTGAGNPQLDVEGTLWGGNLAMINHLIGTPYWPQIDGGILFLEDIGEHPYRVERMLLQLHFAGVLERQRAIVLGDFSGYRLSPHDNGYDFDTMLAYIRSLLPVPVLTGLPFGHGESRCTLPFGGRAHLVSDGEGFDLTASGYPTL
ncbi:muramoyltetrapeptide carboxypeptidase [Duganella sp. Root336D2]|uniref:muramoyltetrapeptide carboxypeptidase n=1 Tax=Duganella sp. Root336D2 TaxID=1736518 RepID=UPI0006F946A3|nr:muramoyltetrapeptide carboxypeptidase [Duganella sp. Root336D2]KQV61375.1 LD-carboxypeptidase [Duganella sp. Root336D2]